MSDRPLDGIRVADFGQFIAGPAVGQILSDFGATVVKVEPLDGEVSRSTGTSGSAMVRAHNRDKLGLAVDLRHPEGLAIAQHLIAGSDVVIQNMRPGTMDRLGLGPETSLEHNSRLVYVSITAFGRDASPTRPGLDIAAQAESGMMSVTGEAGREPQRVGFAVVDAATSYAATNAVLAALFRRERTGQGALIDTSLLEVAIHLQSPNWIDWMRTGVEPSRKGNGQPAVAPAAEVIEVRDGQIVLSAYAPAHWQRLCEVLGRQDLATDPRFMTNDARLQHRSEMKSELSAALNHRTLDQAVELLGENGIVAGAIRTYSQVLGSEDVRRLDSFPATKAGAMGSYRHAASPVAIRGVERETSHSAPAIGEHSRRVLGDLGYTEVQIDRFVSAHVVRDGSSSTDAAPEK